CVLCADRIRSVHNSQRAANDSKVGAVPRKNFRVNQFETQKIHAPFRGLLAAILDGIFILHF
ncbi:MAG: hypothetical protein WA419_05310, partial [Silvibacterium sp.]